MQNLRLIADSRVLASLLHQAREQIDLVIAVHALEYGGHTL